MMVEVEAEAQREGSRVQAKGKWPGGMAGTVPTLSTIGPRPCAKLLRVTIFSCCCNNSKTTHLTGSALIRHYWAVLLQVEMQEDIDVLIW